MLLFNHSTLKRRRAHFLQLFASFGLKRFIRNSFARSPSCLLRKYRARYPSLPLLNRSRRSQPLGTFRVTSARQWRPLPPCDLVRRSVILVRGNVIDAADGLGRSRGGPLVALGLLSWTDALRGM